jgi:DNA-binding response OmpR family regulator/predicted negative regulator of RcsB-dependent stress response
MSGAGKVLILEDDKSLQQSLKALLTRAGHSVLVTSRSEEATEILRNQNVTTLIVDCLLPGASGVDFVAQEVRPRFPASKLDVVLMSGLFTDPSFIKDSLRSTHAIAFLKKPFENEELLKYVRQSQSSAAAGKEQMHPRKALYQLLAKSKVTHREKKKAIEALEEIHGFDLLFIYSLLSESQATGHLNMTTLNGDVQGVSFAQGKIVSVDILDQETQIGKLLLESGHLRPEDLEFVLQSSGGKKLGQKLIEAQRISPHAFKIALANQMSIRLSRTIADAVLKVNFVSTDLELTSPHLDRGVLSQYFHDWLNSKVTTEWLKNHFVQFSQNRLVPAANLEEEHEIFSFQLFQTIPQFLVHLKEATTVEDFLSKAGVLEPSYLRALHLLLIQGFVGLDEIRVQRSKEELTLLLNKIEESLNKSSLEQMINSLSQLLGVTTQEPKDLIVEFKRAFEHMDVESSADLKDQYRKVLKQLDSLQLNEMTNTQDLARFELERRMKAGSLFEEAKTLLQKSDFRRAKALLVQVRELDPYADKVVLYLIWSELGQMDGGKARTDAMGRVDTMMLEIPPEDKFDSIFHFVLGLVAKVKGNTAAARKSFEKALAMDPSFLPARRELSVLNSASGKTDVLHGDLTSLIGSFFKKK